MTDPSQVGKGSSPPHEPSRVDALDGLRALAVSAVFLFHAGVSWAPGGMFGVDFFFVLSGYLITRLLLDEHGATGRIRLGSFWARRARRLLPALGALLITVVLVWRYTAAPAALATLRGDALATLGYFANWHLAFTGQGYFTATTAPSPLLHTWSLAVEEQFYLVWPLVAWLVLRGRTPTAGTRMLRVVAIGVTVAATVATAAQAIAGVNVNRLYYGTDTRAAMLLAGAALATVLPLRAAGGRSLLGPRARRFTAFGGAAALISLCVIVARVGGESGWLYRGGFLLVAVLSAVVLGAVVAVPGAPLSRLLRASPLVALGRVSYAAYLWHWPVILYLTHARTGLSGPGLLAARACATIGVSTASWWLLEVPVRRWWRIGAAARPAGSPRWLRPTRSGLAVSGLAGLLAVALGVAATAPRAPAGFDALSALPVGTAVGGGPHPGPSVGPPAIPPASASPPPPAGLVTGRPVRIGFMGDSQTFMILNGIEQRNSAAGLPVQLSGMALLGCGVLGYAIIKNNDVPQPPAKYLTDCRNWQPAWSSYLQQHLPDVVLLSLGPWEMMDRLWHGAWHNIVDGSDFADFVRSRLVTGLRVAGSTGARVAVLETPCFYGEKPDGTVYPQYRHDRLIKFRQLMNQAIAQVGGNTRLVSATKLLCPGGKFSWTDSQGRKIRMDDIHVTEQGGVEVGQLLLPKLIAWARTGQLPEATDG